MKYLRGQRHDVDEKNITFLYEGEGEGEYPSYRFSGQQQGYFSGSPLIFSRSAGVGVHSGVINFNSRGFVAHTFVTNLSESRFQASCSGRVCHENNGITTGRLVTE